jgi:tripartite-type tricarboxylate transporter receptor subunit TctC
MKKFEFVVIFCLMFPLTCWLPSLQAQTYPSQPIQLTITLAPGDGLDVTGRAIAEQLAKILKTPVVPMNKPGGGGTVGVDFVVKGK